MQAFPKLYPSTIQCFAKTLQQDGVFRGLYAGTLPALVANVAENSVLFCAYGVCQQFVQKIVNKPKATDLSPLENASAGFFAAFFSSVTLCPTELVKCRLQAMRESSQTTGISAFQLTKNIWHQDGLPGFFVGLTPTFAREMPGYFFFFGGYELTRTFLAPKGETKDDIGPVKTIIAGGVGGTCLWVSIFPADVIKSRMQISHEAKLGAFGVMKNLIHREGLLALYNGLIPTVLRTFPSTGALFLAYEYTRKTLNSVFLDR
ncbi:mitochondrial ornithine transporter 1-like isoform X2 [Varroa jacobsoni]|nr:mitochondrial ornithine transporter 1-like isoform X2 [Varroa destructor]XP_022703150.1 mitochondrial ornithine transporter 1-like isoform X2 [Varroa jacobsoni]XP_022703151.1 mitochondrial ornithine transporter 1-like isoform X2 [Varroa jacobsoni]